eukprot:TRINITY_DN8181_c0_g1_i4.p1 TRINITY_DN8181_c0_g1~~TRINITY_DN8181_c0_g1_i4.p1  ORF type:complete len:900 (-),score=165.97 TRINITY_DN8181_c0_g1_i4:469-3168(-)
MRSTASPVSEGRFSPATPTAPSVQDAFASCPDYAKLNSGRINATKTDTFSTPSQLNKKYQTPTRHDKRWGLGDTHDLVEICEKGFENSMSRLGKNILTEMRQEISQSIQSLRDEVQDTVRAQGAARDSCFQQILSQLSELQHDSRLPQKCDFAPLKEELMGLEVLRSESHQNLVQHLQGPLATSVQQLMEEIKGTRQRQDETISDLRGQYADQMESTLQLVRKAESNLEKLLEEQKRMREEIAELQRESSQHFNTFESVLDTQLEKHFGHDIVQVDFQQCIQVVNSVGINISGMGRNLLAEIGKIQQALNVDFAQLCQEIELGRTDLTRKSGLPGTEPIREALANFPNLAPVIPPNSVPPTMPDEGQVQVLKVMKRLRHSLVQTDNPTHAEVAVQTTESRLDDRRKKFALPPAIVAGSGVGGVEPEQATQTKATKETKAGNRNVFADADTVKSQMRQALVKPQYKVCDLYKEEGLFQYVARSVYFESLTFYVITLNTVWIAVDTDLNTAPVLIEAHPVFQVMENCFCFYFSLELFFRFMAFKVKRHCLTDVWFLFDGSLVALMVIDTWFLAVALLAFGFQGNSGLGDASIIRMVRIARLVRISRLVRFLKSVPELMIICKGIGYASRSVVVFFLLWVVIIYIFAVVFRQLIELMGLDNEKFNSVPIAMNTLLLDGVLPDSAKLVDNLTGESALFWPLVMFFVALASVTLMYMLIGVLVDIVAMIAHAEKEGMTTVTLANNLRRALGALGKNTEDALSKYEFEQLLLEPSIMNVIQDNGVDVVVLVDMCDVIFEDLEGGEGDCGLTFERFVDVVLDLRGSNPATVKDSMETRRIVKSIVIEAVDNLEKHVQKQFDDMRFTMHSLREAELRYEEGDVENVEITHASTSDPVTPYSHPGEAE